jgi:Zn-dependent M28 family amino/carboxypeptidase
VRAAAIVCPESRCYHGRVKPSKAVVFKALLGLVLLSAGLAGRRVVAANLPPVPPTVDSITPAELRMHLEFLASDELGGRYTLSPNFAIAARYLAAHLQAYGFHGAVNGHFLQKFDVDSFKADPARTHLQVTVGGKQEVLKFGEDFLIATEGGSGDASGEIVYVGAGISAPEQKHDDYAGLDVKGKIVLVVPTVPAGMDAARLKPAEQGEGAAKAHGAAGMLVVPPQRFSRFLRDKNAVQRIASRSRVVLASEVDGKLPSLTLVPAAAEKLLATAGLGLKAAYENAHKKDPPKVKPVEASASMSVALQQTRTTTQNVAGILEGTDTELKNEYVVFSAHYDHLMTGANGEIYPGADDDGSGTSAILAIAHAMSLQRPKRSVLVIFHAGEELGLLGSQYNTDVAPVVPLDKMVVDLNIDMIGRSRPVGDNQPEDEHLTDAHTVYLVGADRISKELNELSEETNGQFQKLKLDYYYNNPDNPERIYYRSDHWNYAKHGVPIIFYFDGTHVDYHKPTDTVDKIDFSKMTEITRLVFETGWRIANLDHRLVLSH